MTHARTSFLSQYSHDVWMAFAPAGVETVALTKLMRDYMVDRVGPDFVMCPSLERLLGAESRPCP